MIQAPRASSDHGRYVILGGLTAFSVFFGLGTWAAIARLDSAVMAPGIITVETNRKTVQHLEGGIVDEIMVRDTQIVAAGDLLLRLRPVQADASQETQTNALDAALTLEARLIAEQNGAPKVVYPAETLERANRPVTKRTIEGQDRQFAERRASIENQVNILRNRIVQARKQLQGLNASLVGSKASMVSLQAEYKRIKPLADRGQFPVNRAADLQRRVDEGIARVGQIEADVAKTQESIGETELQIIQTEQKFKEDVAQALRDVRVQIGDVTEKIRVTHDVLSRVEVRAPAAGMVQNMRVHTVGGVVRGGEPILDLIPSTDTLNIQARVAPLDGNYIWKGQAAEVKFPGFKDRSIPLIMGKVRERSADTLPGEANKEPYYLAIVEVLESELPKALRGRLGAGMPVELMIATGERTALEYFVGPLLDALRPAGREK
jgi:HlyD family type I secretion membrane fusion protein